MNAAERLTGTTSQIHFSFFVRSEADTVCSFDEPDWFNSGGCATSPKRQRDDWLETDYATEQTPNTEGAIA